jgi:hypothetical protein
MLAALARCLFRCLHWMGPEGICKDDAARVASAARYIDYSFDRDTFRNRNTCLGKQFCVSSRNNRLSDISGNFLAGYFHHMFKIPSRTVGFPYGLADGEGKRV